MAILAGVTVSVFSAALFLTVWQQKIILLIGATPPARAAVPLAYISAVITGLILVKMWLPRISRLRLCIPVLQSGTAITAMAAPFLLELTNYLHILLFGAGNTVPPPPGVSEFLFYIASTALVTALPLALTAALLPVTATLAADNPGQTGRIFLLPVLTAAATSAGILAAGNWLAPVFGLQMSHWLAILLNLVAAAGLTLFLTARRANAPDNGWRVDSGSSESTHPRAGRSHHQDDIRTPGVYHRIAVYPAVLLNGLTCAILVLILLYIPRQTAIPVSGNSIITMGIVFAVITGGFLAGAAAGRLGFAADKPRLMVMSGSFSALLIAAVFIPQPDHTQVTALLLATAIMLTGGFAYWCSMPSPASDHITHRNELIRVTVIMLCGAAAGLIFGFAFTETGTVFMLRTAVLSSLLAALLCWRNQPVSPGINAGFITCLLATSGILLYISSNNESGREEGVTAVAGRALFYHSDPEVTAAQIRSMGVTRFQIKGTDEAVIFSPGHPPHIDPRLWLTVLPYAINSDAETMLIAGLDGSTGTGTLPAELKTVDIVEPWSEVIAASRFRELSTNQPGTIHHNHIRNVFALSDNTYDIIITSPISSIRPDFAQYFSLEYMEQVSRHLNPGGIYLHGIKTDQINIRALKAFLRTLKSVFANTHVYRITPGMIYILAAVDGTDFAGRLFAGSKSITGNLEYFNRAGINTTEDLILALLLDDGGVEEFAGHGDLITDDLNPVVYLHANPGPGEDSSGLSGIPGELDALSNNDSIIRGELQSELDWFYITCRLVSLGFQERAAMIADKQGTRYLRMTIDALIQRQSGDYSAAETTLSRAVAEDPSDQRAAYLMIRPYLDSIATNSAPVEIRQTASELRGLPRSVIQAWGKFHQQDWYGLLSYERELARAETTDPWYPETALMRAMWRMSIASLDFRQAMVKEALRILDRALASYNQIDLYLARIQAAIILGQAEMAMDSAWQIITMMEQLTEQGNTGKHPLNGHATLAAQTAVERMLNWFGEMDAGRYKEELMRLIGKLKQQQQRLDMRTATWR